MPSSPLTGVAPPTSVASPSGSMTPEQFSQLSRSEQLAYLTSTYGNIDQRAGAVPNARFRANNVARLASPEEQQLWSLVKRDGGTFLGNLLHDAAPYALAAGMVAAAPAVIGQLGAGGAAGGAAGGTAAGTGAGAGTGLGIFSNGGAAGLAGVGGGNAGALAASGAIQGGAGSGFLGSLGGTGVLGAGSIKNAARLSSLLGGGGGGSSGGGDVTLPYMGFGSNYGQPAQQQQVPQPQAGMLGSQQRILPSMNQPLQSFSRKPYQFNGATIWV